MYYFLGGVSLVFIAIIVFILLKVDKSKKIKHLETLLSEQGELTKSEEKSYDYILKTKAQNIKLKLVFIGSAHEFSINSPRHWQVKRAGNSNLLKTKGFENIKETKAIVVFPKPQKLVKYINENEIVFVKAEDLSFDFYLFTKDDIKQINNIIK